MTRTRSSPPTRTFQATKSSKTMPVIDTGNHKTYQQFLADVKTAFDKLETKPLFGKLWMDMLIDGYPSVGERMKANGFDPSDLDEIPSDIARAADGYFNMFHGKGWYNSNKHNPNIYPGSGFDYFIERLRSS